MSRLSPIAVRRMVGALLLAIIAGAPAHAEGQEAPRFDVLIRGGRVFDGTGNPAFPADVGIRDGRIVAVGRFANARATRVIDAKGKHVAPGFIDIHSHADDGASIQGGFRDKDPRYRAAPNLVTQGVTTVVVNHDGRSPWPVAEQRAFIEQNGIGPNTLLMVGHGTVRARVMGNDFRRPARPDEIARMQQLVRQAMREGAIGLSAGLEYVPGRWSTTDEVVALTKEIVPFDGVYISHQRAEGGDPMWFWPSQDAAGAPTLMDAVQETIEIGERTGARVVASHIKAKGEHWRGTSQAIIQLIERARARGVDVWADQYTYNTSGTDGNTVLIPEWATSPPTDARAPRGTRADYTAALRATLADSARAAMLRRDIAHEIRRRGGPESVMVFEYPDTAAIGRTVGQLAAKRGVTPVEMAIMLQLEGNPNRRGGGRMRGFSMDESDMEKYAAQPWVATASDAGIALPEEGPNVHARFYGTFPRKIRHYAMDRGVLSVESAIRSMTSLPAQIVGLKDRGQIREGMAADVVVLDLARLRDKATFFQPHQYAEGVELVLVNGVPVAEGGAPTWKLAGKVLTR
ncbi:amidohydrolase family protein [Gemmatimonas sp.]|jgi:N-acyl-D-amino-acid deacylase|uniref:amidohydrolase family protein n=1 Tax=Gemmatimonas sp. TaxID=1962908 RepID=UPI0037BEDA30